ncbi:MAG TPA: FAD-dependent thymidylate synthase, partial [Vicinamibacteria bacterium]|nr:FAD-dependent thymidylate synthase [Vicinamibacteria bacterium]
PPLVTLRNASSRPYDDAIAAARTCYAPRVVGAEEVTPRQRETIGPLTFSGGHHTVWQHAHFEFGLENVSRQLVWTFLHSHPFYNSEQSSQRFVRLDEARAFVPDGLAPGARAVYEGAVEAAWESYRRLTGLLRQDTLRILSGVRHLTPAASERRRRKVEREAEKKAIETARYVIPVAAFTSMVHTVSGIVLHRLHRMARTGDAPAEARAVIGAMVGLVQERDPAFFERIGQGPLAEAEVVEARLPRLAADGDAEAARIDALLGRRVSLLVDHMARAEETTADAVRAVLGLSPDALGDDEAIERLLNPAFNRYRLETLQLSVHSPLGRAMHHASYTFLKKLSHTADSQDQRHRMVPGSRPLMTLTDTREPDYVTPPLVAANPEALEAFHEAMDRAWAAKNRLLDMGVPLEQALYLMPNAKALRFHESGSLLYLAHKWVMRTCFNAQEEIYRASMDELEQVRAIHPRLARHMGPPCVLRHGHVAPICTEGEHFCGIPVWRRFPDVARPL